MSKNFRKIAKISLVLVYLVIIAGAVVRMTGSGMGCPDWPKCFGYYIPPTQASELEWQAQKAYKKGQVIIQNESLLVAHSDFITRDTFRDINWEPYTKHDYAIFNPWHTWIEFINRLLGALAGLATLILAITSFSYWKKKKSITLLSWLVVFAMGFQAWLGATVVYSVLEPIKITVHMIMALIIVGMLLLLIYLSRTGIRTIRYDRSVLILLIISLGITLIQVVLGTQVRQFVDEQVRLIGENPHHWLQEPSVSFYIHRSFSIVVVLINLYLAYLIYARNLGLHKINWVLLILLAEALTGMAMYYWDFPFASQPIHLVLAALLFGVQFYLTLEAFSFKSSPKSL